MAPVFALIWSAKEKKLVAPVNITERSSSLGTLLFPMNVMRRTVT
jgi:hypothetical protein